MFNSPVSNNDTRHRNLLKDISKHSDECNLTANLHQRHALNSIKWSRVLTIPAILIGATSTSIIGFTDSGNCGDNVGYIKISITVLAGMLSVIAGITGVFSFTDKSQQHAIAFSRYSHLSRRMTMLSSDVKDNYVVTRERFNDLLNEMSELSASSPLLVNRPVPASESINV